MHEINSEISFQSFVTIDSYNERSYILRQSELRPLEKLQFKSQNYYVSFIANKDLIIAPLSLSRNLEEEDIPGALEDKAYDELGLDAATEYLIQYYEGSSEGSERNFQVFILEKSRYEELFEEVRQKIRYIDLILPAPLLFQTLYERDILEKRKIHCFLYFTNYDATITFYRNGEYLYSKSIQYSLRQIYDRYCEIVGKTVDEKEFFRILQKEGLKTTHLEYHKNLSQLFNEIFITINDIVIYTKRAYNVDTVDQMYIGSELGPFNGIDEYAQSYLGLYSTSLLFDFKIKSDEWYIDQYHYMMVETAQEYLLGSERLVNFTQNPRPPAFYKRPSGQFFISLAAAIFLASAYPMYFLISSYILEIKNYQLGKKEKDKSAEVAKYKALLGKKRAEMKRLDKELSLLKKRYEAKEKTLKAVYNKKVNYRLKSNQLAAFAYELAKFGLHSREIQSHDDHYEIQIVAQSDRNITALTKEITKKYAQDIEMIDLSHISVDLENGSSLYEGVLKVDFR